MFIIKNNNVLKEIKLYFSKMKLIMVNILIIKIYLDREIGYAISEFFLFF